MGKYFLDCGAHDGCSVRLFRATALDAHEYTIHSFEPNPEFHEALRRIPGVVLHREAVWIENGEIPFYISRAVKHDGSTLISSKTTGALDRERPIMARCLNFGHWIEHTFKEDDLLILKLDIEGAEYAVLQSMINDGSIRKIAILYAEFHAEKIGLAKEIHTRLGIDLKDLGLEVHEWDAIGVHCHVGRVTK